MHIPELQKAEMVTFLAAETPAMKLQARQLCHDTYLRTGYISHPYPSRTIPHKHDADCTYIAAVNAHGTVIGTVRLSRHKPCGIFDIWNGKLYHQFAPLISEARRSHSFEIGALAVNKDCAHLKISWGLYTMAYRWALASRHDYGIISMDLRAFRSLQMVGWHVIRIGEPMNYLGSLTVPAIIPINEQPAGMQATNLPWFKYVAA